MVALAAVELSVWRVPTRGQSRDWLTLWLLAVETAEERARRATRNVEKMAALSGAQHAARAERDDEQAFLAQRKLAREIAAHEQLALQEDEAREADARAVAAAAKRDEVTASVREKQRVAQELARAQSRAAASAAALQAEREAKESALQSTEKRAQARVRERRASQESKQAARAMAGQSATRRAEEIRAAAARERYDNVCCGT